MNRTVTMLEKLAITVGIVIAAILAVNVVARLLWIYFNRIFHVSEIYSPIGGYGPKTFWNIPDDFTREFALHIFAIAVIAMFSGIALLVYAWIGWLIRPKKR